MKTKVYAIIFIFLFVCTVAKAQQAEKFNPEKDKRVISGYTIDLIPMPLNTFGFDIIKGNRAFYIQLSNPFMKGPFGFKNKEDAYKLAGWIVNESNKNGRPPVTIPRSVAKQLNLQTSDVQQ
jgi:hypothetical protein